MKSQALALAYNVAAAVTCGSTACNVVLDVHYMKMNKTSKQQPAWMCVHDAHTQSIIAAHSTHQKSIGCMDVWSPVLVVPNEKAYSSWGMHQSITLPVFSS
jgi:hypothetical protein